MMETHRASPRFSNMAKDCQNFTLLTEQWLMMLIVTLLTVVCSHKEVNVSLMERVDDPTLLTICIQISQASFSVRFLGHKIELSYLVWERKGGKENLIVFCTLNERGKGLEREKKGAEEKRRRREERRRGGGGSMHPFSMYVRRSRKEGSRRGGREVEGQSIRIPSAEP